MYLRISRRATRVTSVDVARQAGVSQSTVSLVLSGKGPGRISAETAAAVRRAAEELGYRPNVAARALRTGAAHTIGLVVTDVTHPFFGPVLRGAQAAAWEAGYAVALLDVANDMGWQEASVAALRSGPVDGFIFFSADPPPAPDLPSVAIEVEPGDMPAVVLDAAAGADAALAHLSELGHTRIAHLASAIEAPTFAIRAARWRACVDDPQLTARSVFDFEAASTAALELLDRPEPPTALFCDDDILAGGVYLAARERGVRIPADVSVVGFDDLPFARVLEPPLTTVAADAEALGVEALSMLLAQIAGESVEHVRVLPVALELRDSTAPPRPAGE